MFDRVLSALTAANLMDKHKATFLSQEMTDDLVLECIENPNPNEMDTYLSSVIPIVGHRIKFVKEFKKLQQESQVEDSTLPMLNEDLSANEDPDPETSLSSSSSSLARKLSNTEVANFSANANDNQVQGAAQKKQKNMGTEESSISVGEGQNRGQSQVPEVNEVALLDNLPPEMLMEILKFVDTRSLFKLRLVNRNFSAVSSGILTNRSDTVLLFDANGGQKPISIGRKMSPCPFGKREKREMPSLKVFVRCMKKSKNCPYARFFFEIDDLEFFDNKDWIEFLREFAPPIQNQNPNQNQSTKIKCLNLGFSVDLAEELGDLLLNKIPNLGDFGLNISSWDDLKIPKLFSSSQAPKLNAVPVQLPYLKVLRIDDAMFLDFPGVVGDLLNAAVNLRSIRGLEHPYCSTRMSKPTSFQFLHSMGKLDLLQTAEIKVDKNFLAAVKRSKPNSGSDSDFSSAFKLRELKLEADARDLDLDPASHAEAANVISSLLESSKSSLRELELAPLGFLPGLQLPTFKNVTTLRLIEPKTYKYVYLFDDSQKLFFPPETRSREIFPAVKDLDFRVADCSIAFPEEDSIPRLPNVRTLRFFDRDFEEECIITLALLCPNLEKLKIRKNVNSNVPDLDFLLIGRAIWSHMQQLVSLEVDVEVNSPGSVFPALDSLFTGIAEENCRGLNHLKLVESGAGKKNQERRRKGRRRRKNIPVPKSEPTTEREHPSILDMKNLKKLVINPYTWKLRHQGKQFFAKNVTWISEEYAFKLMPQLEFNGRRAESTA